MTTPNNQIRRRGSFAPLSASYYDDDAIAEAGEAAELLYCRALAFCARILSDGVITDNQLLRGPGVGMDDAKDRAETLVRVGLWQRLHNGYQIRSWLTWNNSREEIEAQLEADRARKRRPRPGSSPPPPDPGVPGDGPGLPDDVDLGDDGYGDPPPDSDRIPDGIPPDSGRNPAAVRPDSVRSPADTYTYTHTDTDNAGSASRAGAGARTREGPAAEVPRDDRPRPVDRPMRGPRRRGGAAGVAERYGRGVQADTWRVVTAGAARNGVGQALPNEMFRAMCTAVENLVAANRSAGYTDEQLIGAVALCLDKGLHPNALPSVLTELLTRKPDLRPVRAAPTRPARSTTAVESVDAAMIEYRRRRTGGS